MDSQQAKDYCKAHAAEILELQKSRHGKGYVCPICGSGTGKNGTGAFMQGTTNPSYFECFSCGAKGDVFDLVAEINNIPKGSREAFQKTYALAGVSVEPSEKHYHHAPAAANVPEFKQASAQETAPPEPTKPPKDFMQYFAECAARANETDYFSLRGIEPHTVKRFMLGYDPNWISPTALENGKNTYPSPRIIIPVSRSSYLARDTRPDAPPAYSKMKEGSGRELYNLKALQESKTVIVVEGELDAISIEQVGGKAIALRSTTNKDKFVEEVKKNPKHRFILALDNDDAGRAATAEIKEMLKEAGGTHLKRIFEIDIFYRCKDANELLRNNPKKLQELVSSAMRDPALVEYTALSDKSALLDYYAEILNPERGKFYPTGFPDLDKELGGGLFAGLYALGAISSLGKTTFCLQVANNLAKQGIDVLFFSLEMSRTELIAKSISRLSAFYCMEKHQNTLHALTQRQVMSGYAYNRYSDAQREALFAGCEAFEQISPFLYTVEGNFDFSIERLQARIQRHIEATGRRPVVFVDYLQILDFDGEIQGKKNYTDKQKTDMQVKTLKRISRDCNVPVVVISSFNRESYTQPVSMTSFKESGGIEYSCDVLLGLQYKGMDYDSSRDGNLEDKKAKSSRYKYIMELIRNINGSLKAGLPAPVQVKILKNRNGARGQSVYLDFYPRFNLYTSEGKAITANKAWEALAPFKQKPEEYEYNARQHFKNGASQTETECVSAGDGVFEIVSKKQGGEPQ